MHPRVHLCKHACSHSMQALHNPAGLSLSFPCPSFFLLLPALANPVLQAIIQASKKASKRKASNRQASCHALHSLQACMQAVLPCACPFHNPAGSLLQNQFAIMQIHSPSMHAFVLHPSLSLSFFLLVLVLSNPALQTNPPLQTSKQASKKQAMDNYICPSPFHILVLLSSLSCPSNYSPVLVLVHKTTE